MMMIMQKVNMNGVDLNLLPPLAALLKHRHITRAAAEAGMSQPAMSRALARLRHLLGDALLVRGHEGLVLTPRAQTLVPLVAASLAQASALFTPESFDPATILRRIRIVGSDVQAVLLLPRLLRRLKAKAPGLEVQLLPYGPGLQAGMERGDIDFAFALATTPLPPGALSLPLFSESLALVMRKGHPAARKRWQLEDYARHRHAVIAVLGDGLSEVDSQLAAAGLKREIAAITPSFVSALAIVAETDLVTTISESFARHFAKAFGLVVKQTPLLQRQLDVTLVWSHIRDGDATLRWLRGEIAAAAREAHRAP